ncbi:Crp/Fnr family transcriptional regulator [Kitasatospora sp. NPDC057738]|uniref:Crp/Fnr family transcriptional regulator n=1 Tax=Kitasatospora sp. NPDC057738 TaxID=3346233 RepID=UPI0036A32C30
MYDSGDERCALSGDTTFRGLMGGWWKEMTDGWRSKELEAGDPLIFQGSSSNEVFAVQRGALRIERWEDDRDQPAVLAFRASDDLVGETPMIEPEAPRTAQVVAHTRVVVLVGQAERLNRFLVLKKAERLLTTYLAHRAHEMSVVQGRGDAEVRLATLVRPLVRDQLRKTGGRTGQVVLKVSRDHLAQGLQLGHRRARGLLDDLWIGRFHSKGMLTIDLARWAERVSGLRG